MRLVDRLVARVDRRTLLRALPFAMLIVLASGLSYRYHRLLTEQRERVEHTYDVLGLLESTLIAAIDAETGQRGYVITGDDRYLRPYTTAMHDIPQALSSLRVLVGDSPVQVRRVDDLGARVQTKFAELQETIDARQRDGLDAARVVVMRDEGRVAMDELRGDIDTMKRHELDLLARRSSEIRTTERALLAVTLLCATLSVVARFGLALAARRGR